MGIALIPPSLKQEFSAIKLSWLGYPKKRLWDALSLVWYLIGLVLISQPQRWTSVHVIGLLVTYGGLNALLGSLLHSQIQIARSLRKQCCPGANVGVFLLLRWALPLWAIPCVLQLCLPGLEQSLWPVLFATLGLVTMLANAFVAADYQTLLVIKLPKRSPIAHWPYFIICILLPNIYPTWSLLPGAFCISLVVALIMIRLAIKNWRNTTGATSGLSSALMRPGTASHSSDPYQFLLSFFGIGPIWKQFFGYFGIVALANLGFVALSPIDARALSLEIFGIMLLSANILLAPRDWFALYQRRPERALLATMPGLPSAGAQADYLQRLFWLCMLVRFTLPLAFALLWGLIFQAPISMAFFSALLASAILACTVIQIGLSNFAISGHVRIHWRDASATAAPSESTTLRHTGGILGWALCGFLILMLFWPLFGGWWLSAVYVVAAALALHQNLKVDPAFAFTLHIRK